MPLAFLPRTDAALLAWSLNFKTMITATPTDYGLTAALATAYGALHDAYAAALQTATDPSTRTKGSVEAKNASRTALKANARLLANLVNGTASVTDAQKLDLGLTVRDLNPTPIPPPSAAPELDVVNVSGRTVKIRLRDAAVPSRRGRPVGVIGASVFSYVGETPPEDISGWKFEGSTGLTSVSVTFPVTVPPGAQVWLTAFWFNPRKQSGPACTPVSTHVQFGGMSMAA